MQKKVEKNLNVNAITVNNKMSEADRRYVSPLKIVLCFSTACASQRAVRSRKNNLGLILE